MGGATSSGGSSGEGDGSWASLRAGAPRISAATAAPASEGQRILQIRIDEPPISGHFRAEAPRTPWREPRGDYTFVLRNATARAAAATAITAGESPLRRLVRRLLAGRSGNRARTS